MHEEIKEQLSKTYMRGFRAAVSGAARPPESLVECAFGRGYEQGLAAVRLAGNAAAQYAEHVVDSPAMAQAEANAKAGPRATRQASRHDGRPQSLGEDNAAL